MKTRFVVRGGVLERVLERARAGGVELYAVRVHGQELSFSTKTQCAQTMIAILRNLCYDNRESDPAKGAVPGGKTFRVIGMRSLKGLFARSALAGFAVLFVLCCGFLNGRVLDIRIDSENPALVAELLDEYGMKPGVRVDHIRELEDRLNRDLSAGYVFVRQQGVHLLVEVHAREGQTLERAGQTLVAPCDGVVRDILVLSGTACVAPGDFVQEGTVLIEGTIRSENGGEIPTKAVGRVQLEREQIVSSVYETVKKIPFRTGRKVSYTQVEFPFGLYGRALSPYAESETETATTAIGGMFPVRIHRVTVYETDYTVERIDFAKIEPFVLREKIEEAKAACEEEVLSAEAVTIGDGDEVEIRVTLRTLVSCGGDF